MHSSSSDSNFSYDSESDFEETVEERSVQVDQTIEQIIRDQTITDQIKCNKLKKFSADYGSSKAQLWLARYFFQCGSTKKCQRYLEFILFDQCDEHYTEAKYLRANLFEHTQDYVGAFKTYKELSKFRKLRDPFIKAAKYKVGIYYLSKGETRKGLLRLKHSGCKINAKDVEKFVSKKDLIELINSK
jgi:hypothetical protein